jgi:hypothetical protein
VSLPKKSQKSWTVLVLGSALAASAGCGQKTDGLELANVTGVVTLDGQPLPNARIDFSPKVQSAPAAKGKPGGGGSFALADKKGNYRLKFDNKRYGALPGEHVVRVFSYAEPDPTDPPPKPEIIPPKYNLQSRLVFEVQPGRNAIDIALQSK